MRGLLRLLGIVAQGVLLAQAARMLTRAAGGGAAPSPPAPGTGPRDLGRVVRDPVCGVYLPERSAVAVERMAGGSLHFCSEACHHRYAVSAAGGGC